MQAPINLNRSECVHFYWHWFQWDAAIKLHWLCKSQEGTSTPEALGREPTKDLATKLAQATTTLQPSESMQSFLSCPRQRSTSCHSTAPLRQDDWHGPRIRALDQSGKQTEPLRRQLGVWGNADGGEASEWVLHAFPKTVPASRQPSTDWGWAPPWGGRWGRSKVVGKRGRAAQRMQKSNSSTQDPGT